MQRVGHPGDLLAVIVKARLAARRDRHDLERCLRPRHELEQRRADALAVEPPAQPAAPGIVARTAGERDVSAVPGGGHGDVGDRATEVGHEGVGGGDVVERPLADQIDDGLAQTQGRRPGRRLIWTRTAHARGRYPRRRVRVDEHTINLDESPVFYRRATEAPGVPALYLHGIPTSSDDWVEFLARTGGIAPDLIGFGRSGKGGHLDYSVDGNHPVRRTLSRRGAGR